MTHQDGQPKEVAQVHFLVFEPDSEHELRVYGDALRDAFPQASIDLASDMATAMSASEANVLVAKGVFVTQQLVDALPNLAWVHSLISGEDHIRRLNYPTGPVITATRGVHGTQVSEMAIMLMMALNRDFPSFLRAQAAEKWSHRPQATLAGKVALIVGLGRIGEELARLLVSFGMTVDGVSNGRGGLANIRSVYPRERLNEAVSDADFVIALLPLTPETAKIFDRATFAAMKPSAFFVNVARGGVADEEALVAALEAGEIAGAGIDVFSVEPLPAGHALWRAPNVIITPHVAGRSDRYAENACPLLLEAARDFLAGRPHEMPFRVEL